MSARNSLEAKRQRRIRRDSHTLALNAIRDPYRFIVGWCSMLRGWPVTRPNRERRRRNMTHPKYAHLPATCQRSVADKRNRRADA